jgi:TfoX/Sxy family transcriptional regulator of competence genes
MEFERVTPHAVEVWQSVAPPPPAEPRKMFGMPCAFLNGNMFAGTYGDKIIVRLAEADRAKLQKLDGAEPFAPSGRAMREYVGIGAPLIDDRAKVRAWVKKAMAFAETLPPKAPKKAAAKAVRPSVAKRARG